MIDKVNMNEMQSQIEKLLIYKAASIVNCIYADKVNMNEIKSHKLRNY